MLIPFGLLFALALSAATGGAALAQDDTAGASKVAGGLMPKTSMEKDNSTHAHL